MSAHAEEDVDLDNLDMAHGCPELQHTYESKHSCCLIRVALARGVGTDTVSVITDQSSGLDLSRHSRSEPLECGKVEMWNTDSLR